MNPEPHRNRTGDEREHVHHARHYISDTKIAQTERAFDTIVHGDYRGLNARRTPPPARTAEPERPAWWDEPDQKHPAAQVILGLRRSAVVPVALGIACPTCGAPAGVSCGVVIRAACGSRVKVAVLARAAAS